MFIFPENEGNDLLTRSAATIGGSRGEKVSASFMNMWVENPTRALMGMNEIDREAGEWSWSISGLGVLPVPPIKKFTGQLSKKLTEDEWKKSEYFRPGLKFPQGVRENVARIVADKKDEERARQLAIQQGPDDILTNSISIGASLLATMMDPINIASAFIPVVGEARYAYLINKLGLTGARAVRGVVEGGVGAAVVEPIVLAGMASEQADYDLHNSFMNIVFGSILGGGLHVIGGKVADVVRGRPPEIISAEARTAVAQGMSGQRVDVTPYYRLMEDVETNPVTGQVVRRPNRAGKLDPIKEILDTRFNIDSGLEDAVEHLKDIQTRKKAELNPEDKQLLELIKKDPELKRLAEISKKDPADLNDAQIKFLNSFDNRKINKPKETLKAETQADLNKVNRELKARQKSKPKSQAQKRAKETRVKNLETEKQRLEQRLDDIENDRVTDFEPPRYRDITELKQDVERTFRPENDSAYDADAIDSANRVFEKEDFQLDQDLIDMDANVKAAFDNGMITKEQLDAYNARSDGIKESEQARNIGEALAICLAK